MEREEKSKIRKMILGKERANWSEEIEKTKARMDSTDPESFEHRREQNFLKIYADGHEKTLKAMEEEDQRRLDEVKKAIESK